MKPILRLARVLAPLLLIASLPGCLRVEQGITLAKDLSGTAAFTMEMNMEPMAVFMAQMKRSMTGKEGPPTAAEIEASRAELLSQKKDDKKSTEEARAELEKDLPEGLKLLHIDLHEEGLKTRMSLKLAFDHVSKLKQLSVGDDPNDPVSDPFGALDVREEGDKVIVESKPLNPVSDVKAKAAQSPAGQMGDLDKQLRDAFQGMGIEFRVEGAFDVVEHNATETRGDTLVWSYDFESLEKLEAHPEQGIRVVFQK